MYFIFYTLNTAAKKLGTKVRFRSGSSSYLESPIVAINKNERFFAILEYQTSVNDLICREA